MKIIYLIKRGPRPEYHKAPFHPVILCTLKRIADWEKGASDNHAWMWIRPADSNGYGWLITRWNGLDIDYGHAVRSIELPDGSSAAFWRDYEKWPVGVQDLLEGAAWWSMDRIPDWFAARGIKYPADEFTQQWILDNYADDGCSGFGRKPLPFWPQEEVPAP